MWFNVSTFLLKSSASQRLHGSCSPLPFDGLNNSLLVFMYLTIGSMLSCSTNFVNCSFGGLEVVISSTKKEFFFQVKCSKDCILEQGKLSTKYFGGVLKSRMLRIPYNKRKWKLSSMFCLKRVSLSFVDICLCSQS